MCPPAANPQWIFDHGTGKWVYGYLLPVGELRDGRVPASIQYVTPPLGSYGPADRSVPA